MQRVWQGIKAESGQSGRSSLLTAIGNAQRYATPSRQQELAPTKNLEIPIQSR